MSLKTSFFNKTLVKSDFKRLWWIPAVHTLAIFLMSVFTFMERYFNSSGASAVALPFNTDCELTYSTLYRFSTPVFVTALIVPVVLAVFLFSYLQSVKAVTFAHSVPVSRRASFVSHTVSGILMFLIPLVVNGAILLLMRFDSGFAQTFSVSHLFMCLFVAFLYSLVAFSFTTFVAMLCGNVVANFVLTYIFAILPLALEAFLKFFASVQLFGFVLESSIWCAKYLYLTADKVLTGYGISLYIILSAVFSVGAFVLYRKRNLENHSEVVAFPVLRPIFVFGVAICSGAVGFAYINGLWDVENPLTMLPFGILGLIIATMLVKKSFRNLKLLKPVLVYSLVVVCIFCIFNYDLTGFESRVPDSEDVEYVTFELNGVNPVNHGWYYEESGKKYKMLEDFSPDVKEYEDIINVCNLHTYLAERGRENLDNAWKVTLKYNLKNGRTLLREYDIDYTVHKEFLEPIVTTDIIRMAYFPILRDVKRTYTSASVYDERTPESVMFQDKVVLDEFLEALKKDTKHAPYDEFTGRGRTYTRIEVSYKTAAIYEDGTPVTDEEVQEKSEIYYIRPSYTNTMAVLEKHNALPQVPEAADIKKIGVDYYGIYGKLKTVQFTEIGNWTFPFVIENPDEIAEVYEYSKNNRNLNSDMSVMFFTDSGSFSCEMLSTAPDFPECLKKLLNP